MKEYQLSHQSHSESESLRKSINWVIRGPVMSWGTTVLNGEHACRGRIRIMDSEGVEESLNLRF